MSNAFYTNWKENIMSDDSDYNLDSAEGSTGVYAALVDTGTYTFSAAHDFYNDLSGVVGTDQEITSKTITGGVFDGANLTYPSISGDSAEAIVLYRRNAGANTTWPLICYLDTGHTGLPVTPNSGDITITWNATGIFLL